MSSNAIKVGDRIIINEMVGEPLYAGKTGEITYIDGIGQLHGTWGGLAIQPEHDSFTIIKH